MSRARVVYVTGGAELSITPTSAVEEPAGGGEFALELMRQAAFIALIAASSITTRVAAQSNGYQFDEFVPQPVVVDNVDYRPPYVAKKIPRFHRLYQQDEIARVEWEADSKAPLDYYPTKVHTFPQHDFAETAYLAQEPDNSTPQVYFPTRVHSFPLYHQDEITRVEWEADSKAPLDYYPTVVSIFPKHDHAEIAYLAQEPDNSAPRVVVPDKFNSFTLYHQDELPRVEWEPDSKAPLVVVPKVIHLFPTFAQDEIPSSAVTIVEEYERLQYLVEKKKVQLYQNYQQDEVFTRTEEESQAPRFVEGKRVQVFKLYHQDEYSSDSIGVEPDSRAPLYVAPKTVSVFIPQLEEERVDPRGLADDYWVAPRVVGVDRVIRIEQYQSDELSSVVTSDDYNVPSIIRKKKPVVRPVYHSDEFVAQIVDVDYQLIPFVVARPIVLFKQPLFDEISITPVTAFEDEYYYVRPFVKPPVIVTDNYFSYDPGWKLINTHVWRLWRKSQGIWWPLSI